MFTPDTLIASLYVIMKSASKPGHLHLALSVYRTFTGGAKAHIAHFSIILVDQSINTNLYLHQ